MKTNHLALLPLLLIGCGTEVNIDDNNTAPEADLSGNPSQLTKGSWVQFSGKITDGEQDSEDLTAAWSFRDPSNTPLSLEIGDDCAEGPTDTNTVLGQVRCSFRVPTDIDRLTVGLAGSDNNRTGKEDTVNVTLDSGGSPTCALVAPTAESPDGAYFADVDILVDGACEDSSGETAPGDLDLWFEDTFRPKDGGAPVTWEYRAEGADTGDTGGVTLVQEADGDDARLYGYVGFTASDHQLCLFARDEAGNLNGNGSCVTFTVDPPNSTPWCEILLPGDGTTGNAGDPVYFEGFVGDVDQSPSEIEALWRSDQVGDIGYSTPDAETGFIRFTEEEAFASPGRHVITLKVTDEWGLDDTCDITYTVGTGPSVVITTPTSGDIFDLRQTIPLECEYSDGQSACVDMQIAWDLYDPLTATTTTLWGPGTPTSPSSSPPCYENFTYDPTTYGELEEGFYYFYCRVTDETPYSNQDGVFVLIDDCMETFYEDLDNDTYGNLSVTTEDCPDASGNPPAGWSRDSSDCDDYTFTTNPGASELCNGVDDNCDGIVDNGFHLVTFYQDSDGDGYGDSAVPYPTLACSGATISGYAALGGDCDDTRTDVNPGEAEQCDDIDHNCDGDIDDGFAYPYGTVLYLDADGDGYGTTETPSCSPISGYALDDGDCDDTDSGIYPGATEVCDVGSPVDDDCDGVADESGADGCTPHYLDADGDGFGDDAGTSACVCDANPGSYTSDNAGDCDDTEYTVNPDAEEVCDAADVDEDCDGNADTEDALGCSLFYYDYDGDDYYTAGAASRCLCDADGLYQGHTTGDCDDTDAVINPAATEVCDALNTDEDCDGLSDDADGSASGQSTWYRDADEDGYGHPSVTLARCDQPSGYVSDNNDCDDTSDDTRPGGSEVCDAANADEDCDGLADDADPSATGQSTWYVDTDGDGYGVSSSTLSMCDQPSGYSAYRTDCDDATASTHPGATEFAGDEVDSDCDGTELCYDDDDNDGYLDGTADTRASADTDCADSFEGTSSDPTTDCDDSNAAIHPGATEGIGDGIDSDCDGTELCYDDDDNDGYLDATSDTRTSTDGDCSDPYEGTSSDPTTDCDDNNSSIHPGVSETVGDGVDYNCDGTEICYVDADNDGYRLEGSSTTVTSTDIDCNGAGEGTDSDPATDCDDSCGTCYPGRTEACDGYDNDCDDDVDEAGASGCTTYYYDGDGDSWGISSSSSCFCAADIAGDFDATRSGDCDDGSTSRYPGATYIQTPSSITGTSGISVHTLGDLDTHGHGPDVECTAEYTLTARGFSTEINCSWEETESDWSSGEMVTYTHSYTSIAPTGCTFASLTAVDGTVLSGSTTSATETLSYTDTDHAMDTLGGTRWISSLEVYGDNDGDDFDCGDGGWASGSDTCSRVNQMDFYPVTLTYE